MHTTRDCADSRACENIAIRPERAGFGRLTGNSAREDRAVRRCFGAALVLVFALGGCASQGDFLRLQEQVAEMNTRDRGDRDPFARIAQLSTEVDAMRQEIRGLQGELEVARKEAAEALAEVQRTRTSLAQQSAGEAETAAVAGVASVEAGGASGAASGAAGGGASGAVVAVAPPRAPAPAPDQELAGYQNALDSWRKDDFSACIERFTAFLQAYPTSGYADDAAYWLADCTYRNAEYKRAVIRFADVVRVYPDSPKAPDALYRQGESLLKLGPRFQEAARTVFKRLQNDYPDSERSLEAARQLDRLSPG